MKAILSSVLIYSMALSFGAPSFAHPVSYASTALQQDEDALAVVRRMDREGRGADGQLEMLSAAEHLRRGNLYLTNRAFTEARTHFQALIQRYPDDSNVPQALYGTGRSYFQAQQYQESLTWFERLARDYPQTKDGREGLYSLASALVRMGRAGDGVERFREYTERFPQGERLEAAYLNVIDGLREAGRPDEAIEWIARTREKFTGTATAVNALFARLRLDVSRGDWQHAIETSDQLRGGSLFMKGVQTNPTELAYLRAYSLERAGRLEEAINSYLAIPDDINSYYGGLATSRLLAIKTAASRAVVTDRVNRFKSQVAASATLYPAPYRETIVPAATRRKLDPRLVLAIMRQESNFRPRAKSQAAARGLLQLTIDTALKYSARAGLRNLQEVELYRPEVSILVGSEYLSELSQRFPERTEAVVASYNGGEDNVARWIKRAVQPDAGVFASEVGFSETKEYVFRVMSSYRVYRQLYTADLRQR